MFKKMEFSKEAKVTAAEVKTAYDSANVSKVWGPAGTGKSTVPQVIANMRNRPLVTFICSADTRMYDFIKPYHLL